MKKSILSSNGNMLNDKPRIVVVGGGTGTFVVLRGLKYYPVKLSAIVAMSDSGGSNRRLRDEFGLLPTSDIRQCLVALSEDDHGAGLLRKLFMYRFEKGKGISGMTFGNLFMAALTDILGSQKDAISQSGQVLKIHGKVIPVSYTKTNLSAQYEDGHVVGEEHFIDEPVHDGKIPITNIWLSPKAEANPDAIKALSKADVIILGPGDLYTSVLPNILVSGIKEAIRKSHATVVYVMNLMTKYGQTYGFTARDHIRIVEKYMGSSIDIIVLNTSRLPEKALKVYQKAHEVPVVDDIEDQAPYTVVRAKLASENETKKASSDTLVRSLIRHDSNKLALILNKIVESMKGTL